MAVHPIKDVGDDLCGGAAPDASWLTLRPCPNGHRATPRAVMRSIMLRSYRSGGLGDRPASRWRSTRSRDWWSPPWYLGLGPGFGGLIGRRYQRALVGAGGLFVPFSSTSASAGSCVLFGAVGIVGAKRGLSLFGIPRMSGGGSLRPLSVLYVPLHVGGLLRPL